MKYNLVDSNNIIKSKVELSQYEVDALNYAYALNGSTLRYIAN
jgi:hypothetical protein